MAAFTKNNRSGKRSESQAAATAAARTAGRTRTEARRAVSAAAASGLEALESRLLFAAVRLDPSFNVNDLGVGDDRSFPTIGSAGFSLGFTTPINFFGSLYNGVFVNNNGHISLGARNSVYTNVNLDSLAAKVIAPFYANVDTRFSGSTVKYGQGVIDGRRAFAVNWLNVDYQPSATSHANKNSFQLVLIDRSDLGAGSFDIEFNYDKVTWESGASSGGNALGLGGSSARVGWQANNGTLEGIFQMAGSGVAGSFLDSNLETGLVHNSFMSDVDGRYVFRFREGTWADAPTGGGENTAPTLDLPDTTVLVENDFGTAWLDLVASFEDPDADSWLASVDYGDGWGAQPLLLDGTSFVLNNAYLTPGAHTLTVTIDDGNGGVATDTMTVLVEDYSAPVVSVNGPLTLRENETGVFMLDLSNDTDLNDSYTIEWFGQGVADFGDFYFLADDNGSYTVSVKLTDGSGNYTIVDVPVTVENVAPTASGLLGADAVDEGGSLTLGLDGATDVSAADLASGLLYSFDFDGDGVFELTSAAASATHVYADSGTYLVRARVSDKDGGYSEYTKAVTVAHVAPVAAGVAGAADGDEGHALVFALSGSTDASSADVDAGFTYSFDFDGDGLFEVVGSSAAVSHVFDDNGHYTVRARVSDKDGGYSDYTHDVHVRNVPPRWGRFTDNNPIAEGSAVTVSFDGLEDPSMADTAAGFTYSYDFDGDGVFEVSGRSASATHVFGDNGVYTVTGRVTDKDGGYTDYTTDVEVYNVDPTAGGLAVAGATTEGSTVTFSLGGASDVSAADLAAGLTYSFDLDNDGTFDVVGSSPTVSRLFLNDGTHTVRARVTDKDGGYSDHTATVVISNVAPVVTGLVNPAATLGNATAGSNVSLDLSFTDAGVLDSHTVLVDWGDGKSTLVTAASLNGAGSASASHVYTQGGVYNVTLRLSDDAQPAGVALASSQVFVTGVGLHNGILQIVGTNGDDRVRITADNKGAIRIQGDVVKDAVFSGTSVREIRATLGLGRDTFDVASDVTKPVYYNGAPYYGSKGKPGITNTVFSDRLVA